MQSKHREKILFANIGLAKRPSKSVSIKLGVKGKYYAPPVSVLHFDVSEKKPSSRAPQSL
jgi:hypothetical protein